MIRARLTIGISALLLALGSRLWCSGLRFVDGIGGTVTGAAQNARLAATIG